MGCRIAAGITTGMVMVMVIVLVMMVLVRVILIAIEFLTILMFSGTLAILVAQPTDVVKVCNKLKILIELNSFDESRSFRSLIIAIQNFRFQKQIWST